MQWFIDLVKELIHGQLGYFDRGDPASQDFTKTDFTLDLAWHELDLSGIVPVGTKAVSLIVMIRSGTLYKQIQLRKAGNVNAIARGVSVVFGANVTIFQDIVCSVSADRKIEYLCSTEPVTTLNISVKGWWLR